MPRTSAFIAASLLTCRGLALLSLHAKGAVSDEFGFKEGEIMESWDYRTSRWLTSTYLSKGGVDRSHTVARWDDGVLPNLPDYDVRKMEPFKEGEVVQVLDGIPNIWISCHAIKNGSLPNTYDIEFPGNMVMPTVPAVALRRAPVFKVGDRVRWYWPENQYWMDANITYESPWSPKLYNVSVKVIGTIPLQDPTALAPPEDFAPGDEVQIFNPANQLWANQCIMVQNGTKDDSYNVMVPQLGELNDIPAGYVRKMQKRMNTIFGAEVNGGDLLEVMDTATNSWTPCKVLGKGGHNFTYNIIAPMMGRKDNVSVLILRKFSRLEIGEPAEILDWRTGAWIKGLVVGDGQAENTYDVDVPKLQLFRNIPEIKVRRYLSPIPGERMEVFDRRNKLWSPCDIAGLGEKNSTFIIRLEGVGRMEGIPELMLRRRARTAEFGY